MKRACIVLTCLLALGLAWTYYELRKYKASNETDMPGDIGAAPDFYASDPALLEPVARKLQFRAAPSESGSRYSPYLIAFADGSYVWGRTNMDDGLTQAVFSDKPYELYWDADADEQWLRRNPSGGLCPPNCDLPSAPPAGSTPRP